MNYSLNYRFLFSSQTFNWAPASSRAVLVQITPVLGVLVGIVVTLILIAICIVIFVKIKNKVTLPRLTLRRAKND